MTRTPEPQAEPAPGPDGKVDDPTPHAPGQTTPSTSDGLAPRLPHERDESADSQSSAPQPLIEQALRDVERGLVDTGRAPVTDELYHRMAHSDDDTVPRPSPEPPETPKPSERKP